MQLPGETNVFSGDRLCTRRDAVLTLVSTPQESLQLAPESCVRVTKDGATTRIALEQGTVTFTSAGAARVVFESYRISVLSKPGFQTVADVSLRNAREAQACVVQGWVEVARFGQQAINEGMVLLGGSQSGLLALDNGGGLVVVSTGECPPSHKKAALAALGIAGGAAAIALPLLLRDDGPVSPSVP